MPVRGQSTNNHNLYRQNNTSEKEKCQLEVRVQIITIWIDKATDGTNIMSLMWFTIDVPY